MKIIKTALLLSGLFFSCFSISAEDPPEVGTCAVGDVIPGVGCAVSAPSAKKWNSSVSFADTRKTFSDKDLSIAQKAACTWFLGVSASNTTAGHRECTGGRSIRYKNCNWITNPPPATGGYCDFSGSWQYSTTNGTDYQSSTPEHYCPPDDPRFASFGNLYGTGVNTKCTKDFDPPPPIDCSALNGLPTSMLDDSFQVKTSVGYTKDNPPSCVRKTGKDKDGKTRSGDCKVISKSWGLNVSADGQNQKWFPMAGTLTGAACGENENTEPPPEPPKCWKTKNNLNMCIQDPAEKCLTVNGVQQCEAGCGYVNKEFFCVDKQPVEKPKPPKKDKPLPDVNDTIADPTKLSADMTKQDFKDTQIGVESRITGLTIGVADVENAVDGVGFTLDAIDDKLDDANGLAQQQIGYLDGIHNAILNSSGGGNGNGDGDGDCDPLSDKNCGEPGGSKSWWKSLYPDGFSGMVSENMEDFLQSPTYESLTTELVINGGATPNLTLCFNFGFADFGCHTPEIPAFIWNFIKACFLFYAAILARRLLIGA